MVPYSIIQASEMSRFVCQNTRNKPNNPNAGRAGLVQSFVRKTHRSLGKQRSKRGYTSTSANKGIKARFKVKKQSPKQYWLKDKISTGNHKDE